MLLLGKMELGSEGFLGASSNIKLPCCCSLLACISTFVKELGSCGIDEDDEDGGVTEKNCSIFVFCLASSASLNVFFAFTYRPLVCLGACFFCPLLSCIPSPIISPELSSNPDMAKGEKSPPWSSSASCSFLSVSLLPKVLFRISTLFWIIRHMVSSTVCLAITYNRRTLSLLFWPSRWIRSSACRIAPGVQYSSAKMATLAAVKVMPTPQARMPSKATDTQGSFWNRLTSLCRFDCSVVPSIRTYVTSSRLSPSSI